jgi:hypothetical protein
MSNLDNIIQVSTEDINFWMQRLTEHTFFLKSLLNPQIVPDLQLEANELYQIFTTHIQRNSEYNAHLINALYALLATINIRMKDFGNINLLLSPNDFYDLIQHMILEQTYFVRLFEGKMTVQYELLFWLREISEHMSLISHLLPPNQLKIQAANIGNILEQTRIAALQDSSILLNDADLIRSSNEISLNITNSIRSGQIQGVDLATVEHEYIEAVKGFERVQYLLSLLSV